MSEKKTFLWLSDQIKPITKARKEALNRQADKAKEKEEVS